MEKKLGFFFQFIYIKYLPWPKSNTLRNLGSFTKAKYSFQLFFVTISFSVIVRYFFIKKKRVKEKKKRVKGKKLDVDLKKKKKLQKQTWLLCTKKEL